MEKEQDSPKKIGLALGGGGARGLAHIGVIKVLERAGVKIDCIAGTSMGALVGGWYAATRNIGFLENSFKKFRKRDVFSVPRMLRRRDGILFRDQSMLEDLEEDLRDINVENCPIPFKAVATDVKDGNEVVIGKGNLLGAIKASTAIPVIFKPVSFNKGLLIDGGLVNPVPADVVRAMGADYVIAVDVSSRWIDVSQEPIHFSHPAAVFANALSVVEYQLARHTLEQADMIVRPAVMGFKWLEFGVAKNIVAAGEEAMECNLAELKEKTGYHEPTKTPLGKFFDFLFGGG